MKKIFIILMLVFSVSTVYAEDLFYLLYQYKNMPSFSIRNPQDNETVEAMRKNSIYYIENCFTDLIEKKVTKDGAIIIGYSCSNATMTYLNAIVIDKSIECINFSFLNDDGEILLNYSWNCDVLKLSK